ncbi:hypothetical protein MJO10_31265, partial [Salmonella enterica subsp. enterica serovar Anatum]|nr:hypothetical protein [Salmonella enterica subsp. enterica serovar Anatum]
SGPFSLPLRATSFTATLVTLYLHPEAELRPFEIPCFLSNYAEIGTQAEADIAAQQDTLSVE